MKDAQSLYDALFLRAEKIIKRGDQHEPFIFVLNDNGDLGILPLKDAPNRESILIAHQGIAAIAETECAILIMEAWVLKINDPAKFIETVRTAELAGIKDHPQREEALIFNFLCKGGKHGIAACKIQRSSNTLEKAEIMWLQDDEAPTDTIH